MKIFLHFCTILCSASSHHVQTPLQVAPFTSKAKPFVQPVVPYIEKAKPYVPAGVLTVLALSTPPVLLCCAIVAFITAPVRTKPARPGGDGNCTLLEAYAKWQIIGKNLLIMPDLPRSALTSCE